MGYEAGRCKTSTPYGIFIVIPSLEGWPTKAKKVPSPHDVRLAPLDTYPVFQSVGRKVSKDLSKDRNIGKSLKRNLPTHARIENRHLTLS